VKKTLTNILVWLFLQWLPVFEFLAQCCKN